MLRRVSRCALIRVVVCLKQKMQCCGNPSIQSVRQRTNDIARLEDEAKAFFAGAHIFNGISFPASLFGNRRLRPLQPVEARCGVRDAVAFSPKLRPLSYLPIDEKIKAHHPSDLICMISFSTAVCVWLSSLPPTRVQTTTLKSPKPSTLPAIDRIQ